MSWLNNVNNLLAKLDGQAETMAEMVAEQDQLSDEVGIDNILAKRGLSSVTSEDEDGDQVDDEVEEEEIKEGEDEDTIIIGEDDEEKAEDLMTVDKAAGPQLPVENEARETVENSGKVTTVERLPNIDIRNDLVKVDTRKGTGKPSTLILTEQQEKDTSTTGTLEVLALQDISSPKRKGGELQTNDENSNGYTPETQEEKDAKENAIPAKLPSLPKSGDGATSSPPSTPQMSLSTMKAAPLQEASTLLFGPPKKQQPLAVNSPSRSKRELAQAQKEARILRRHVVSLNEQLETAESELQAQRKELERAADRMEKDRVRQKGEKDSSQKRNAQQIELLKAQNEKSVKEQQARFEEQLERYRKKLSEEEKRRKQQGGDWDKEMSNAIDREQEMGQALNALEDEKAVLLSQISTLQGQQAVLGSRLESLTQATDNAMERERDSENRLDVALNQHARQISQRQARESELERTVQELNAALVVSSQSNTNDDSPYRAGANNTHLKARISALEMDLQTTNSQLVMEREQSETLQMHLRSFSNESTQEASMVHAKEIQYDRKIADMSLTISKLEAKVKEYEKEAPIDSNPLAGSLNDEEMSSRIKLLSEEVVRLRDKLANHNSESLAMKSRLQVAIQKSNKLEEELLLARTSPNGDGDLYDSMERAHKTAPSARRSRFGAQSNGSMRTAMLLNSSQGDGTEKIGKVVDQIDSFAASTGKYLRRNPIARAGFIFYLMLIHLWTFVLLFFHAHSFDIIPNGSSAGHYSHGPHAMMQQHEMNKNIDIMMNADANAAVPSSVGKKQISSDKKHIKMKIDKKSQPM
mmetsp:Transcript_6492/g.13791  ORF Transcript_6492/g.13791 Transcript_6492/m.13791 type:complete len:814 (+) Transcript_6492:83-2524(+)